jgi:hypothetical protein
MLYDAFRDVSKDCLLGFMVLPDDKAGLTMSNPQIREDIVPESVFHKLNPNLIYLEGGLFSDHEGSWRVPRPMLEQAIREGASVVVADVDINLLRHQKQHYDDATSLFEVIVAYQKSQVNEPVACEDRDSFWEGHKQIICNPSQMVISEWLKPAYDGVSEIVVGLAARLTNWQNLLASGNSGSSGVIRHEGMFDDFEPEACPFASVARLGSGHAVFIAGCVSGDVWARRCPGNTKWLLNTARLLVEESSQDKDRAASHLRSPFSLFLSHRNANKATVEIASIQIKRRGIGIWFDKEQLVPSDSLVSQINHGLENMTHFVLFWSKDCVGAPWVEKELNAAIAMLVEKKLPIIIVRLDKEARVPAILGDLYRIEASSLTGTQMGNYIADAVEQLADRAGRRHAG